MPSQNAKRASPAAAGTGPQDLAEHHDRHPSNNSPGDRAQDRPRSRGGLNRGERQHLQTREKAESLAETIRSYWAALGVEVDAFIIPICTGEFAVRSDLKLAASPDGVQP